MDSGIDNGTSASACEALSEKCGDFGMPAATSVHLSMPESINGLALRSQKRISASWAVPANFNAASCGMGGQSSSSWFFG
jgi:hypothetical protein